MTVIGALAIGTGTAIFIKDTTDGDDVAAAAFVVGVPLTTLGVVLTAVGIPLWVVGGREIPVKPEHQAWIVMPDVSVGPRSASLRWSF